MIHRFDSQVHSTVFLILFQFILLLVFAAPTFSFANDRSPDSLANKKNSDKLKQRNYPGGQDEEDLEVQSQLPNPGRGHNLPGGKDGKLPSEG